MKILRRLALGLLAFASAGLAQTRPTAPSDLLAAAVALPDAKARRAAAQELAQRKDIGLEAWLAAARGFGVFAPLAPGAHHEVVDLLVLGKVEKTTLSTYVPKSYDPSTPAPLLLAMHGTGMNGRREHLMWAAVAEALGMLIVAPSESGPNEGYAFTERERQVAFAALRWMRLRANVDETRLVCSGESRGGHMTWDLGLRNPGFFAALAPMIGGPMLNPAKGLNNLRYLEGIADTPVRDLQGARDDQQLVYQVRLAFERLKAFPARDAVLHEFPNLGHSFDFAAVDWVAWLGALRRDPVPQRIVRPFARKGEGRAFWLEVTGYDKSVEEEFSPRMSAKEVEALERKPIEERKLWWAKQAEDRTGRAVATWKPEGPFQVESRGASALRLLLDDRMLAGRKEIEVVWNGKKRKVTPNRSARVLLLEFVERFDRSFLPVVEVALP